METREDLDLLCKEYDEKMLERTRLQNAINRNYFDLRKIKQLIINLIEREKK